jgi:tetratricopeptide (TPR) repeat protein
VDAILKFLSSNKDALLVVIAGITVTLTLFTLLFGSGFLVAFFKSIAAYLQQRRHPRIPPLDTFPFEVIKPNSDILKAVFGGARDNPLADRNIRYLQRVADRDIQQELEAQLEESRWVIILGETGLGKTREAAELAQKYSRRGWTVLRLKHSELLDEPYQFPMEQVGSDRKLLFFLDDLNKLMYKRGELLKDDPRQFRDLPPQERLRLTLEYYERFCRPEEIRIIATARNETVPQYNEPISELDKLGFDQHPRLWQKFTRYLLVKPSDAAIIQLIQATVEQTDITANPDEYARLARRNDRTFRNIQLNLQTAKDEGRALTLDTFRESLRENWEAKYRKARRKYPIAAVIYDAVELLRAVNVELHDFTVIATTQMLAGGNFLQRLQRWQPIRRALHYLIHDGNSILEPRDGQVEAKGTSVAVAENIPRLSRLLLRLSDRHSQVLVSLYSFAVAANGLKCCRESFTSLNELLKVVPHVDFIWFQRGNSLTQWGSLLKDSGQNQQASEKFLDAIASYDQAIAIKSDKHEVWHGRGNALDELKRHEEAIASYDQAIAIKSDKHEVWHGRGNALDELKRHEEAIASYDQALAFKPDYYEVWSNRGTALYKLECYAEAIASYDQALAFKPDYYEVWSNRGTALYKLECYAEAVASYDQALAFKPDYYEVWSNRGTALYKLECYEEAIASYDQAITIKSDKHEAWYGRGIVLSNLKRHEEAIASYDQAIAIKPDEHVAWYNRGATLMKSGDYKNAIQSFDMSLEFLPDDAGAFYNKARCFALWDKVEEAVANLQRAIELNPDKYREMAKTDADFDGIRGDGRFQALMAADG